jgi:hypothetical protein
VGEQSELLLAQYSDQSFEPLPANLASFDPIHATAQSLASASVAANTLAGDMT